MRKIAGFVVIALGLLALLGADGGTYQGGTYGAKGASYQSGGAAKADTVRIVSRDRLFPNTAARTAGYITGTDTTGAIINQGSAGQAVRWAFANRGSPNTVYYDASAPYTSCYIYAPYSVAEDDRSWVAGTYIGFVWVSANGLKAGMKAEKFYLCLNTGAFAPMTITGTSYLSARLDTIPGDYAMSTSSILGYAADTDTARMDISWNEVDATGDIAWSPTLDARDDYHDFGPRSANIIGAGSYPVATPLLFDVTDAVQQVLDKNDQALVDRGFIFVICGVGSGFGSYPAFSAGDYAGYVGAGASGGKGCPTFWGTATTRRGPREWPGLAPAPMAVIFDDQYPVQRDYALAMEAGGKQFEIAAYQTAVAVYTWVDSLYAVKPELFGLIHHSKTHTSLGGLTADQLAPELSRKWFPTEFTGFSAADTTSILDTSWPFGVTTPRKGSLAMSEMVNFGYRAARGYGGSWTDVDIGAEYETWLSWDGYANVFNVKATVISGVMAAADMADEVGDLIDIAYTDHAKAPIILYGHRNTTAPADGITAAKLTQLIGITDAMWATQIVPYESIITSRLSGATFVRPQVASAGARNVATVDSVAIRKAAAISDSLYAAGGDPNYLQMWIGPK